MLDVSEVLVRRGLRAVWPASCDLLGKLLLGLAVVVSDERHGGWLRTSIFTPWSLEDLSINAARWQDHRRLALSLPTDAVRIHKREAEALEEIKRDQWLHMLVASLSSPAESLGKGARVSSMLRLFLAAKEDPVQSNNTRPSNV